MSLNVLRVAAVHHGTGQSQTIIYGSAVPAAVSGWWNDMYENPIEMICKDLETKINTDFENKVMCEINRQMEIKIDKHELTKALQYDRDQYNKGYSDAEKMADFILHWLADNFDAPCNYNTHVHDVAVFIGEEDEDWCADGCGMHSVFECWKKYFELYKNIDSWGET